MVAGRAVIVLAFRTPLVHCAWSVLCRLRLPLSFRVLPVVLSFMSFGCVTALLGLAPHVTGLSLSMAVMQHLSMSRFHPDLPSRWTLEQ